MVNQLLGASPALAAVRDQLSRLLGRQAGPQRRLPPVLIQGETGTGKGLVAHVIHQTGPRAGMPFVDVNCAAIPDTLLEAEVFGFERGAFTDARQAKSGLLQTAHRGTIFLDEIGLMPVALQAKLLKALEDRAVRRLGATRSEPVDVWVLAATSEDLQAAVRSRRFREDLYHRLAVVTLRLPPLRERGADILLLARHYLGRACVDYGVRLKTLTADAESALAAYGWPGNVRELANVMERVVLLSDGEQVTSSTLGLPLEAARRAPVTDSDSTVDQQIAALERARIEEALHAAGGNISRAAAQLGLARNTLRYRMERNGLTESAAGGRRKRASDPGATRPVEAAARDRAVTDPVRWQRTRVTLLEVHVPVPDPDTSVAEQERHRALEQAAAKAVAFGGRVLDLRASGLLAAFGLAPIEDAPRHAAHAALAMLHSVRAQRTTTAQSPQLRIALHADEMLVGRLDRRVEIDADARRAADRVLAELRASAASEPLLVSAGTKPLLDRRFTLEPVARADRLNATAWRVTGLLDPTRRAAPFVARARELELLDDLFTQVEKGRGQAVLLVGDPGIGKSRLLQELQQRTRDRAGWFEGHAVSFGRSLPFHPLIDLLKRACGVDDGDPEQAIGQKIEHAAARLGGERRPPAAFLRVMLSIDPGDAAVAAMDPSLRRAGMFEAVRHFLLASAEARPLVVMLEDAHWMDEATTEFLALMAESVESSRILLCVTHRAGFVLPFGEGVFQTRLTMSRLSQAETAAIAGALLGVPALSPELQRLLYAKTDGNPFFVEEVARSLFESSLLERRGDTIGLAHPMETIDVPDTIQDVILARLERLDSRAREMLHVAAVIGREFSRRVLEQVIAENGSEDSLDDCVHALLAAELIQKGRVWPEVAYVFRHAVTQEVAYQDQREAQRQALHARIGRAMELVYAEGLSEHFGVLAYHFTRAQQWTKSLEYLLAAARQAERSFATREALALYDEAKSAAEQQAGGVAAAATLMAIHAAKARLHFVRSDFEQSAAEAERILPLARLTGDAVKEGEALATIAWASTWGRNLDAALRFARDALAVAEPAGAVAVQGRAYFTIGFVHGVTGVLTESQAALDKALSLSTAAGDAVHRSLSLSTAGLLRNWEGDYEVAVRLQNEGLGLARDHGLLVPLLFSCFLRGLTLTSKGDYDEALASFSEGLVLAERVGDEAIHHRLLNCLGWLYAELGDLDHAEALNTASAEIGRRRRDPGTQPNAELNLGDIIRARGDLPLAQEVYDGVYRYWNDPGTSQWMRFRYSIRMFASLGELALVRGNLTAARAYSAECLDLATRTGSRKNLVKGWRLVGEIERAQQDWDRAEQHLRTALELAASVGNPVQYWKTELALGQLLSDLRRPGEAREAFERANLRMQQVRGSLRHERLQDAFEKSAELRLVRGLVAGAV
jgi:transcriptional regulator with AAA-type ATPase domain/tetratricopeptide (TPR) repeat protein